MTVKELINHLMETSLNYDVYVESLDGQDDYFCNGVSVNITEETVHIKTAQ